MFRGNAGRGSEDGGFRPGLGRPGLGARAGLAIGACGSLGRWVLDREYPDNSCELKPVRSGSCPPVYFLYILTKLPMKKSFSFAVTVCQKYGFWIVTSTPVSPAHSLRCCSSSVMGFRPVNDSIAVKWSNTQVFPMEKVPLLFSLALCNRTRPDLRTATIMVRTFLFSAAELGGGGAEGDEASSTIRMCVMYDSATAQLVSSQRTLIAYRTFWNCGEASYTSRPALSS